MRRGRLGRRATRRHLGEGAAGVVGAPQIPVEGADAMAYKLDPAAPLDAEFRRIAGEQLRRAERVLVAADGDPNAAVHEARKRLKKLRKLLRLLLLLL